MLRLAALRIALLAALLVAGLLPAAGVRAESGTIALRDVAGRSVALPGPARRVVLAEGRHLIALGLLERERPSRRVVALGRSLPDYHPDLFETYAAADPGLREVPVIGDAHDQAFSPEAIADLNPDLIVMPIGALASLQDSGTLAAFETLGLPVIFVDFRQHPLANVAPSMRALGLALGRLQEAEAFLAEREAGLAELAARAREQTERPTLLLHVARSLSEDCCLAFGDGSMGEVLELLGLRNPAAELSRQPFVRLNPETILASDPTVVVSTVALWRRPDGATVLDLGYRVPPPDPAAARAALLTLRPEWSELGALRDGRAHLVPHVLYDTPFQVFLAGLFAKWAWPEAFADYDPLARFAALHDRFMPFPLTGTHSLDLPPLERD